MGAFVFISPRMFSLVCEQAVRREGILRTTEKIASRVWWIYELNDNWPYTGTQLIISRGRTCHLCQNSMPCMDIACHIQGQNVSPLSEQHAMHGYSQSYLGVERVTFVRTLCHPCIQLVISRDRTCHVCQNIMSYMYIAYHIQGDNVPPLSEHYARHVG